MTQPSNQPTLPRRIAKYGILGTFLGVGVVEAISFLFFACPCAPTYVRPELAVDQKPAESIPAPPKFGTPVTP